MEEKLIIKRLEKEVIKKLKKLYSAQINVKDLICKTIMDYEIEKQSIILRVE